MADAEVIACVCQALEAVGVKNYKVRLNDRAGFAGLSPEAVRSIDKIDKIGLDGVVKEMEDKGVSSAEIENAKLMLGENAKQNVPENIAKLIEMIQSFGVSATVEFDPSIARGLDYYTGTVFEIYLSDKPEYGSICSGGRYDNLTGIFGLPGLSGVFIGEQTILFDSLKIMNSSGFCSYIFCPVASLIVNAQCGRALMLAVFSTVKTTLCDLLAAFVSSLPVSAAVLAASLPVAVLAISPLFSLAAGFMAVSSKARPSGSIALASPLGQVTVRAPKKPHFTATPTLILPVVGSLGGITTSSTCTPSVCSPGVASAGTVNV